MDTQIPKFFHITETRVHNSNIMKEIPYESKAYYIFNRGYNDFKSLYHIHLVEAKFVVRAKKNMKFMTFKWKRKFPPIRDSCKYVVYKDKKEFRADIKNIYIPPTKRLLPRNLTILKRNGEESILMLYFHRETTGMT